MTDNLTKMVQSILHPDMERLAEIGFVAANDEEGGIETRIS